MEEDQKDYRLIAYSTGLREMNKAILFLIALAAKQPSTAVNVP